MQSGGGVFCKVVRVYLFYRVSLTYELSGVHLNSREAI